MNSFPAILLGGPPHSGKSVLTYLLTKELRTRQVAHYVLHACPDGEGDWSQEASLESVQLLRQKGQFSTEFVDRVCRDLARRHLPLLVDVGGKPTPDQERIFDLCTHAVIVSCSDDGLAEWRERCTRHGLAIIAELRSVLNGEDEIVATTPVLRGQIAGLERRQATAGPMTQALLARLQEVLAYGRDELAAYNLATAPTELAVDVERLAGLLEVPNSDHRWQPAYLPAALAYAPSEALSLYGRGPNWLYAAFALHVTPQPFFLFDVRLGWTAPVTLIPTANAHSAHIHWQLEPGQDFAHLELKPGVPYLDYEELAGAELPLLDPTQGVVLSGKIPYWLLVGAALAYRDHPWIGVVQAQNPEDPTIVFSRTPAHPAGAPLALR
jgi:CRISPR-associated protein Csx3